MLTLRYCAVYCSSSDSDTEGFCGRFCNRGQPRPDLMMVAHEIARDEFFYESDDANIAALKTFSVF